MNKQQQEDLLSELTEKIRTAILKELENYSNTKKDLSVDIKYPDISDKPSDSGEKSDYYKLSNNSYDRFCKYVHVKYIDEKEQYVVNSISVLASTNENEKYEEFDVINSWSLEKDVKYPKDRFHNLYQSCTKEEVMNAIDSFNLKENIKTIIKDHMKTKD